MKTVTLTAFNEAKGEFEDIAAIHYDGKKLTGTGDPVTYRFVLSQPITLRGDERGPRIVTTAEPLEFLHGLNKHYRSVLLSAGAVHDDGKK